MKTRNKLYKFSPFGGVRGGFITLCILLTLTATSCKKDKKEPQLQTDVYVAGYVYVETEGITKAKVWKNSQELYDLTSGTNGAWAFSVFVTDNDDIYVSGNVQNSSTDKMDAKVWKNGTVVYSIEDVWWDWGSALYVSGGDVYLAGSKYEGGYIRAMVWKNGEKLYSLSSGDLESMAYSVYVSGSDVYVAGSERNNRFIATVWKNGAKLYSLTDETENAYARSVYVYNDDVYVAGREYNDGKWLAKIWINDDEEHTLADDAGAYSVYVSDGDVYAAGRVSGEAMYWKNDVSIKLTNDASRWEDASSVFVLDNDVYVAGNGAGKAAVWKNNTPTYLTDTDMTSEGVAAASVFVTQRMR